MESFEWDTVTAQTWPLHLPEILQHLSTCSFVALDFEFSGIAAHRTASSNHASLQERYADTKEAAEKFQILQVGLTIAHEDADSGRYTLKPYNVHLSPLIDPILGIDRIFSISSAAIQFLLKSDFRMDTPFTDGVRYLTQKEEEQAVEEARRHGSHVRTTEAAIVQMDLSKDNAESSALIAEARERIDNWVARGRAGGEYLNFPSRQSKPFRGKPPVTSLNRFQKRLVHQLVEKEYPLLTSYGRHDFVTIRRYDEKREEIVLQQKIERVEKRLLDQRGFRWIIEAISGGDLSQLDNKTFDSVVLDCRNLSRETAVNNVAERIKSALERKKPPVVGHNLFIDVIYMWRCFFGELPDRIEDFIKLVHAKFPLLIDTKYLFTHDCGDVNPVASLDEMDNTLKGVTKPKIVIDSKHTRYQQGQHLHEAGYDSLLTAKNFIRQASLLPDAGPREKAPVEAKLEIRPPKPASDRLSFAELQAKIAYQNVFAALPEDDTDDIDGESGDDHEEAALIPSFASSVWKVYGNKLRVFGTRERHEWKLKFCIDEIIYSSNE